MHNKSVKFVAAFPGKQKDQLRVSDGVLSAIHGGLAYANGSSGGLDTRYNACSPFFRF